MYDRRPLRSTLAANALWALLCAFGLPAAASAAPVDVQFRHVGIDDGLPSSQVTDILRDRRGFMWIGSAHGVSRFDSHRFRTYDLGARGEVSSQVVRQIYEDGAGDIWVVTSTHLNLYSTGRDAFVSFSARNLGVSPKDPPALTCISEDARGRLLVGSTDGVLLVDRKTGTATGFPLNTSEGARNPAVNALHRGRDRLWVGTDWGLFAVDGNGRAEHWTHVMGVLDGSDTVIRTLATDRSGALWIGTGYGGVARRDPGSGEFSRYRHADEDPDSLAADRVARIIAESDGAGVWIALENHGVDYFDPQDAKFRHVRNDPSNSYSLRSDAVWSLYQDPAGLLWVGTFSAGFDMSMPNGIAIRHYLSSPADPGSLSNNAVSGFLVDSSQRTWVSTDGGGLNRFDAATSRFERFTARNTNLNSDAVLSIAQGKDGNLWVATWAGGISRFDPATRRFTAYTTKNSDIPNDNVYEVLVDRAGDVWVGADNGIVARLDAGLRTFSKAFNVVPDGFKWSSVLVLRELADGRLAAGLREGGLTILDPVSGSTVHYLASEGTLASNSVRTIHESQPGILWVGTDAGLDRLDLEADKRTHWDVEDGLSSRYIDGVLSDAKGRLWISTDKGLDRFDPVTHRFRIFTRADGLQGSEFLMRSAYRAPDGTLLFGGNNGFNAIRPAQIIDATAAPVVVLTDLLVFNKPVRPGEEDSPLPAALDSLQSLEVPRSQNVLTFQFTALEYSAPGSVRYAYRLEGFDRDWQDARERAEATYTNLAPGRYEFHVRASDIDGAWHDAARPLALTITPALWQTWWFRVGAGLVLLAAVVWAWRFQYKRRLEIELGRALVDAALFRASYPEHGNARAAREPERESDLARAG